jgi:hypothetical protein
MDIEKKKKALWKMEGSSKFSHLPAVGPLVRSLGALKGGKRSSAGLPCIIGASS